MVIRVSCYLIWIKLYTNYVVLVQTEGYLCSFVAVLVIVSTRYVKKYKNGTMVE